MTSRPIHDASLSYPSVASTLYEVGDILAVDGSGIASPASSLADAGTEAGNQAALSSAFVGFSNSKKLATDTTTDTVEAIVAQDVQVACDSATFKIGDFVGGVEDASGTALERNKVKKVTAESDAIAVVVEHYASATTKVWVRPLTVFAQGRAAE